MTLRELAKGYDGDVLIKAYENEKSKIPTAIMQSSVTDAIKDEILDREIYSYAMAYQSLFTSNLRVNFAAAPEETEETTREPTFSIQSLPAYARTQLLSA